MAKFKVGDKARFITRSKTCVHQKLPLGSVVTIAKVGAEGINCEGVIQKKDYLVAFGVGVGAVMEWQLEPIVDTGSWKEIEATTGWKPSVSENRGELLAKDEKSPVSSLVQIGTENSTPISS